MKVFKLIDDVECTWANSDGNVKESISMKDWMVLMMDQYQKWSKGYANIKRGEKIYNIVMAGIDTIKLEDADYDELWSAIDSGAINPKIARRVLPFYEAVKNAEKPEKKEK